MFLLFYSIRNYYFPNLKHPEMSVKILWKPGNWKLSILEELDSPYPWKKKNSCYLIAFMMTFNQLDFTENKLFKLILLLGYVGRVYSTLS